MMENIDYAELPAEMLTDVTGGQTTNPDAGNWQATGANMGTAFIYRNMLWHRLAYGETLGKLAGMYGTSVHQIRVWNPLTTDPTQVLQAGAALVVKKEPTSWDFANYPQYQF